MPSTNSPELSPGAHQKQKSEWLKLFTDEVDFAP